jgi:hypothetical protein
MSDEALDFLYMFLSGFLYGAVITVVVLWILHIV